MTVTERISVQDKERGVERCVGIVTDEGRRPGAKYARRRAVAHARPLVCVTPIAGSAATRCTPFLASEPARAITVVVLTEFEPSA